MPKETKKFNFAKEFKELEDITAWFEKEEIDLEEGLRRFERGLALAASLKSYLQKIDHKVKEIKIKFAAEEPSEENDAPFDN